MLISPSFIKYGYKGNLFFYDNLLTKKIVGHEGNLGNLASQVKSLKNYMSSPSRRFQYITLLIHNIESPSLANEIAQNCLVQLASSPNIHLVASIDHINSGMLWDISKITLFNFAWHDVTNYSPYTVETSFENSLVSKGVVAGHDQAGASARAVLQSVNQHTKEIFALLAKHQLKECTDAEIASDVVCSINMGLTFDALFSKAQAAFCAAEQTIFRTLLTEFKDHGMIVSQRDVDGSDMLYIPMTSDLMTELIAEISIR